VYVRTAGGFEPREIRVKAFTSTVAVIDGLDPNVEIALINPNKAGTTPARATQPTTQRAS
jgi:hypothetical protein